ncbi:GumC family protein [Planktothrix paucivesiculata]|uniref:Lipopolysaccharide biosynthesis protein n=1 Tax=Planktothrix paucivesiculata PCC 9631 TaxID=671071 RepID=A0A7Z9BWQ2_9CYAN|nr:lipopolysaccharide biosynthesis [Planktothrix paucivesiculata]VXD21294.1 Lipopolysaccharide biosynthesis protein [Planktothrix paucivesiculata PCC 9631]
MTLPIVKRYLIAFDQYKLAGFATFIVALGASGAAAMLMEPPVAPPYKATGILTAQSSPVIFSKTGEVIQQQGQQLAPEMLLPQSIVGPMVKEFKIVPEELKDRLGIKLEPAIPATKELPGTPMKITVSFQDSNRERAVVFVNQLMDKMQQQSRIINAQQLNSIINLIQERLKPAEAELRKAEKALENYDKREGATILSLESGSLPAAILANEQQQKQIQLQLDALDAQVMSLESQLGLNADQAFVSQALATDPIIAQLRVQLYEIESQLAVLRKDYKDQHPSVAELVKRQQAAEQQLQSRASEVLGGDGIAAPLRQVDQIRVDSSLDPTRQQLAQTLIGLKTQKESLEQQLISSQKTGEDLKRSYADIPNKQSEKQRLEQQVAFKKALYDQMQARLVDAKAAEAEITSSLAIAKEAQAPDIEIPKALSMALMLAIGGLAGVLGGGVIIFILGMLSGKFYTWEEIQGAFKEREIPLLGVVPNVFLFPEDYVLPLLLKRYSPYLEFYEKIRSNLQRVGNKSPKVILITSVGAAEGKTLSAYNLAIAAARSGKRTLLIEADLRSPSEVESLGLPLDPQSGVEPLQYYGDLYGCIRLVPDVSNLYVIPSPGGVRHPATVLESSELRRLLEEVRYRFDFVVVDSPALEGNNDVLTLEPYTDGMVIVTRPVYTSSGLLGEVTDRLMDTEDEDPKKYRPRLLGAIVNGADVFVDYFEEDSLEHDQPVRAQPRPRPALKPKAPHKKQKRLPARARK